MLNIIQNELELARTKMLEEEKFGGKHLVKLTQENVAIVEAMIRNDSAYIRSMDVDAVLKYNKKNKMVYGGSSAFWMTQLKRMLLDKNEKSEYSYEEIIKGAVEAVDRENSAHINADKCGRKEISDRLSSFDRDELIKCLQNPEYKDMKLIEVIAKKTSAKAKARTNLSFASKFCHYACYYLFEGMNFQDNYSIYDDILREIIPLFLARYNFTKDFNLKDYKEYRKAVDELRTAFGIEISQNGFDQLLWYYYRERI